MYIIGNNSNEVFYSKLLLYRSSYQFVILMGKFFLLLIQKSIERENWNSQRGPLYQSREAEKGNWKI